MSFFTTTATTVPESDAMMAILAEYAPFAAAALAALVAISIAAPRLFNKSTPPKAAAPAKKAAKTVSYRTEHACALAKQIKLHVCHAATHRALVPSSPRPPRRLLAPPCRRQTLTTPLPPSPATP